MAKQHKKKSAPITPQQPGLPSAEAKRFRWWGIVEEMFGMDLRTLALVRVGMGLLILGDLWIRGTDLADHYTDLGILPRGIQLEKYTNLWEFSIHWTTGTVLGTSILFGIAAAAAMMLMVGYRTRFFTFVSWIFIISLQNRNAMVNHSGDVLFRMLIFWSMFLPLGARYSVDAALEPIETKKPQRFLSAATAAILLQVSFLYLFSVTQKTGPEWRIDNTAVYYALHVDQFVTRAGIWLRQYEDFLKFLTWSTVRFEFIGPLLLFLPYPFTPLRIGAWLGFLMMHTGFEVCLGIGIFPFFCFLAVSAFIPSAVWDWLGKRVRRPDASLISVFYDGECGFCKKAVLIIRELLAISALNVSPAAENSEPAYLMRDKRSWVIRDHENTYHFGWDAFVILVRHSPIFFPFASVMGLRFFSWFGELLYRLISSRRNTLGLWSQRFLPYRERPFPNSATTNLVAGSFLVFVFMWNLTTIPGSTLDVSPASWMAIALRIDQRWNMFAPGPLKEDGWFVVPGKLENGRDVDVKNFVETPPSWEKPEVLSDTFPNERWQKYLMNLMMASNSSHRLYYGQWLCRQWNNTRFAGRKLKDFEMFFMEEDTTPTGKTPPRKISLWKHNCF